MLKKALIVVVFLIAAFVMFVAESGMNAFIAVFVSFGEADLVAATARKK